MTTDAEGRFTLPGFPKGKSYGLMVLAGEKPPYFVTCLERARHAPVSTDRGQRRVRRRAFRCGSS